MRRTPLCLLLAAGLVAPASAAASIERASVSSAGAQGDAPSGHGDPWGGISASGRFVVFHSAASNLAAGGPLARFDDGATHVFLRDRREDTTVRLSGARGGAGPEISADGSRVLYRHLDGDLVLLDRSRGTERRIPLRRKRAAERRTLLIDRALARDGRTVVFVTARRDRFGEVRDHALYRYRVRSGAVRRVSPFVIDLRDLAVSQTGRYVAFTTAGFTRGYDGGPRTRGVFVRDLRTGRNVRVDVNDRGGRANRLSFEPSISADGRLVAFTSEATNLAGGAASRRYRVYVRDLARARTRLVSSGAGDAGSPALAPNGRRVAFTTRAAGEALYDNDGPFGEVRVRDRRSGRVTLISATRSGAPSARSGFAALARGGRLVAFASASGDLVAGDTNGLTDVFVAR